MTTERAIKQTQVSVSRVRRAIEKKLQQRVRLHRSRAREENLRLRISLLEQEIAKRQSKLEQEKLACQARDKEKADRGARLAFTACLKNKWSPGRPQSSGCHFDWKLVFTLGEPKC